MFGVKSRITLAASLVAALSGSVHAQSSVTLYGIIDTGVEYISHASSKGDSVIRMPAVTGELPSRWGMSGKEDLGNNLKATFILESGFNSNNGSLGQGGRLFGRQAWVGMESPYGVLSFGRQYTMSAWVLNDADIIGPDIYGLGAFDLYIPSARSDNTIAYKGTFYGLTVGGTYSFGRDAAGTGNVLGEGLCAGSVPSDSRQCRQWTAMLKYDSTSFGVAAAYDDQRGGTGSSISFFNGAVPFPFSTSADKDIRMHLNGWARYGAFKLGGGWLGRRVTTQAAADVHSDLFYLGASYQVTSALTIDGEAYRIVNHQQDARATK